MRVITVYDIDGSEVVCMDAVDFLGPLVTRKEGQRIKLGTVCSAVADRWQVGDEGAIFGHETVKLKCQSKERRWFLVC